MWTNSPALPLVIVFEQLVLLVPDLQPFLHRLTQAAKRVSFVLLQLLLRSIEMKACCTFSKYVNDW